MFTPQLWDRNGSGTQPGARVHTCSTASGRSGTSRPPRDVIAVERFRNGSGWLCGVNARRPVPEPFQLPVTFVDSQPILHISKRSSLHGILPQIVWSATDWSGYLPWSNMGKMPDCPNFGRSGHSKSSCANYVVRSSPIYSAISRGTTDIVSLS